MNRKKDMHFVSDLDKLFQEFDRTNEFSESQKAELTKYEGIYKLRDATQTTESEKEK